MTLPCIEPRDRLLMGPGPSNVHRRVLEAMSQPTIGHLDPIFSDMMDAVKDLLRKMFQTRNALTIPLSGPGSVAMETCFVNLVEPHDEVIICINGAFGERMADVAKRCGGTVFRVDAPWGQAIDVEAAKEAIAANPTAKILAFIHAETSTGVCNDAEALCRLANERGLLSIADAVTSLAGIPVNADGWQADAVYSGTQKCLSCPPGLSLLTMSEKAEAKIRQRKTPIQSWFMDLSLLMAYWDGEGGRTYHHTAPVNAIYGLYQALRDVQDEGLEARWSRHKTAHQALVAALESLGLDMVVDEAVRLPQLNAVAIPDGVDDAKVRGILINDHDIEIGAGLGPFAGKIWRVGLMGETARLENVRRLITALGSTLNAMDFKCDTDEALARIEDLND